LNEINEYSQEDSPFNSRSVVKYRSILYWSFSNYLVYSLLQIALTSV